MVTERADFQSPFNVWASSTEGKTLLFYMFGHRSFSFELKVMRGKSLSINEVKRHQVGSLIKANESSLYVRLEDSGHGERDKSPFDCLLLYDTESFLVIWPYVPRQRITEREALFVRIHDWVDLVKEAEALSRKSVRIERIREVAALSTNVWKIYP